MNRLTWHIEASVVSRKAESIWRNRKKVRRIVAAVEPFEFERIYGAWWGKTVFTDAKAAVRRSAERYIRAISGWTGDKSGVTGWEESP